MSKGAMPPRPPPKPPGPPVAWVPAGVPGAGVAAAGAGGGANTLSYTQSDSLLANVRTVLPDGLTSPNRILAMASAPRRPGNQGTWRRSCGSGRGRRREHLVVHPVGLAPGEREDRLAGRVNIAEQDIGDGFGAAKARE